MRIPFRPGPAAAVAAAACTAVALIGGSSPVSAAGDGPGTTATPVTVCGDPAPGMLACDAVALPGAPHARSRQSAAQDGATLPLGYGPADLQSAYGLGPAVAAHAGRRATVALVDAGDAPTLEADLAVYRSTYGLPPCTTANGCLRKVGQDGGDTLPAADPSWAVETSLDADAASAACPDCRILVVEADQASAGGLGAAVDTAVRLGATVVSNSYSGSESGVSDSNPPSYQPAGRASYDHPGVPILAASGDTGYQLDAPYPADLRSVVAVGGTSLTRTATGRGWTESAWGNPPGRSSAAGAACSAHVAKPSWQHDTACPGRTVSDVSAVADPRTPLAVYDSTPDPGDGLPGGWVRVGGTSAATPLVAAMWAMSGHTAGVRDASGLYARHDQLNDVSGGYSISIPGSGQECPATSYLCSAVRGYDGPTGLGSPHGLGVFGR